MRKRNIKSVAHWVIMSILLLFPVLMVGISAFANSEQSVTVNETYEYETNEINNAYDIVVGNIYKFDLTGDDNYFSSYIRNGYIDFNYVKGPAKWSFNDNIYNEYYETVNTNFDNLYLHFTVDSSGSAIITLCDENNDLIVFDSDDLYLIDTYYFYGVITEVSNDFDYNYNFISESDYLGLSTITVDIQNASYKQEVNNWANGFKNLPVNQWYGSLLNTIGVGQTDNSVMNVIYVYPLYVLWVYILDVIVDCFLVIINFGHNALHRLGGDNE